MFNVIAEDKLSEEYKIIMKNLKKLRDEWYNERRGK